MVRWLHLRVPTFMVYSILIAAAFSARLLFPALLAQGFATGNLVVYRVGTGAGSLLNTGNPVFLDEYTPAGALVQSIALPTTIDGANRRLIASGTATSEGLLTRSVDGRFLILTGYDAPIPTTGLAGTAATAVNRVVARVDGSGAIDTTTALTDFATANNPRSAASTDGSDLWFAGAAGGIRYAALGSTTSTQVSTTVANIRSSEIFDGQLFISDSSGSAVRLGTVGTGVPKTAGQTITNLPGFPTATGSPYAFLFADLTPAVPGVDTLYVADDGAGVQKFSLVSGSWVANGVVGTASDAYRGLTGVVDGTIVTLYATRKGGSGASGGGELVSLIDNSGYNATLSGVPTPLATAATNTAFRGVALAPTSATSTTPTVTLEVSTTSGSEAAQTVVTVTANASAAVTGAQTVSLAVTGSGITTDDYLLSAATITIPDGATSGSVTFTVVDDAIFEGTETATLTISNPSAGILLGNPVAQTITIDDNDVAPPACAAPDTPIHAIQGAGAAAAITGTVTVQGVVIGDYEGPAPAQRGFYLQEATPDADPATSEGIFIFTGDINNVSLGQVVQVTGTAMEFQDQTEIAASVIENCGTTAAVTPVDVTLPVPPPVNGVPYLERFEGMLVRFPQALSVTEHFQLGRFGQIVMSSGGRLPQPTSIVAPGAPAQAQQAANDLNRIIVDDDLQNQNPDPIQFGRGGNPLGALNTLRGGDSVSGMVGVLTYAWAGNAASGNAYRLRPNTALGGGIPNFQPTNPRPSGPPLVGGRLKIASFNVLNYFLTLDIGTQANCGPIGNKQECRGAENTEELTRQQQKLDQALRRLDGDVVGMMELENSQNAQGQDVNPLADIVDRLNSTLGANTYASIDTGVIGTDTIRVGIIYKPAKVTPIGAPLVDNNPVHNRPPVAQLFSEIATGERFTAIVNHFKSKGSCPANPADPDADQGDGQDCWNATRVQQAHALLSFINTSVIPTNGDPDVLLLGDFNSYAKEDPIRTLEEGGFTNLVARFSGASAYSYAFDGQWGYLDQALASAGLVGQATGAGDYHINADEPSVLDYNTNFKSPGQVVSLFNGDEFRTSDHDPVVVGLNLRPLPQANTDNYAAEAGGNLVVDAATGVLANDGGGPLTIISHTNPAHGTLTLNADGSFTYVPTTGFFGTDSFDYTVSNGLQVQSYGTNVAPLAVIDGVTIKGSAFGSALAAVPGSSDEVYGLTDRGPNVDGPGGTKIEPLPAFVPSIGKFKFVGAQAVLEQVIPLQSAGGAPFSGRVNAQANTGETITDLNGTALASDPNGFDPEGLVALPDGTFWISDEYGPFISHFDATGHEMTRLSPYDGTLPAELRNRVVNRGMEGLTITPDGSLLVGVMQSALQQTDLGGFDAKKLTPVRIVTYRLADGDVHEYLYLLDDPNATKTAISEITALSNTTFLLDERDGNFPPGAYKKLYRIDLAGATDVGPHTSRGTYDALNGGALINGKTIENLLRNGSAPFDTAASLAELAANGITPVSKTLHLDLGAVLTSIDSQGRFFPHDKIEGVIASNGGATMIIANDSDFGIDGVTNNAPPFQLRTKISPATGQQDDGEFLIVDMVRSTATVTIETHDTIAPETILDSTPPNPSASASAAFEFHGTDNGSGVSGFECALDGPVFATCASGVSVGGLANGPHSFAVRAVDAAGNRDASPATFDWTVAVVTGSPNLSISSINAPAAVAPGLGIAVSNTVANTGTVPAAAFRVGLYLSTDAVCTTADTLVGSRMVAGLAAGASSTAATTVTMPAATPLGAAFLCAIADDLGAVAESSETDNTGNTPIAIVSATPTVTLKINGQHPNPAVVTTTGPLTLTLDIAASTYTAPLSWYWAIVYNNQLFWVTSTGLSLTPAPLLIAPPAATTNATLVNFTLPPGASFASLFMLVDGAGTPVGLDLIAAVRP